MSFFIANSSRHDYEDEADVAAKSNGEGKPDTKSNNDEDMLCWQTEAAAIIQDVKDHVSFIGISPHLSNEANRIYLNVRTLEGDTYCIAASNQGFCILSRTFDVTDGDDSDEWFEINSTSSDETLDEEGRRCKYFETMYSLLDYISPMYVMSFGSNLCEKLQKLL